MTGTAICDALDALVDLWTPTAPDGWDVVDGQARELRRRSLLVGWDHEAVAAVTARRGRGNYNGVQDAESMAVVCILTGWAGDGATRTLRDEAFAAFDVFDAALAIDRTLGDRCMDARVSEMQYMTGVRIEGSLARIRFVVDIDAFG